ncbi:class I SAM-dependent methyltransferase [Aspergillus saccharolyticus JOP 1030-1]|uniref:S-adenosyl-L-methionine-dependent methyltransferase n=1 Tax=Aspergillus saccharolyticus JOP 1030-1 TaxID=1450539 RepID=A0A318ZTW9_9EURO|nr:S-adenosyl-L-methionine-dependent methyltransferase [Aspergillus saccharolyticus JOP 1030-1]PYH43538.1 S-adenosyl-L-methionine-dependent methyltransferase [Aspergillus saccharolyticus JOP 1030-1]
MSASRVGRAGLKSAKGAASAAAAPRPSPKHKLQPPSGTTPTLSKRANPLLTNFHNHPPSTTTLLTPRMMTIMGVSILGISTYIGYLYASYTREVTHSQSLAVSSDVTDRYNRTARTFDADVNMSETLMRLGSKRRELVQRARGDVLEVSCGTGRNIEYYDFEPRRGLVDEKKGVVGMRGCQSVTFVDLSPQMVEIAEQKFKEVHPELVRSGRVEFRVQDAAQVTPPSQKLTNTKQRQRGCFDTVVQTMGLCSLPDPVGTLRHLGTLVEPQRGEILLLEHGRSYYGWLNRVLDNLAPAHADRHGCWWNRDIGEIVRESGLEVVEEKRWHFGTTWKYVLRPPRKAACEK